MVYSHIFFVLEVSYETFEGFPDSMLGFCTSHS